MGAPVGLLVAGAVAAVGAAVAVAVSSSSSDAPGGDVLTIRFPKPTGPTSGEKFADPIYACLGTGIAPELLAGDALTGVAVPYILSPNKMKIPQDLGHGYLKGIERNAASRIQALRNKMGKAPAADVVFPKTSVGALAEASFKSVQQISGQIVAAYGDAKRYGEIAERFGIPISQVAEQAKQIGVLRETVKQAQLVEQVAKFAPIAATLSAGIRRFVEGGAFDPVTTLGPALAAAAISLGGGAVPIVGQVMTLALDLYTQTMAARRAGTEKVCVEFFDRIEAIAKTRSAENFPEILHLMTDAGVPCTKSGYDYDRMLFIEGAERGSLHAFRNLSPRDKHNVQRWWATAATLMSHPEVYNAFAKLGHGIGAYTRGSVATPVGDGYKRKGGALYGGMLASDEQVMLVAAPIAIANGLNVDAFARQLWDTSRGWRSADPASIESGVIPQGYSWTTNATGDPTDDVTVRTCPNYIGNAWWLNWATLARDAFALVDKR